MHALFFLLGMASATPVLWDGRLNNYTTAAFLSSWSFSNPVGPYQYYIHGSGLLSEYVSLSPDFANPADSSSNQGLRISIDNTSTWNGQTMLRTELIPQTSAPITTGKVFYHFSLQHTTTNPPSQSSEHQLCFFESHFTEMKYLDGQLHWFANGESHWNSSFEAGVWHNVAYGIDFDAKTVAFWHSIGAGELVLEAGPVAASTESNGADWHLGVLRLSGEGREDWFFSGVFVESGELSKGVSGPAAATTLQREMKAPSSTGNAKASTTSCSVAENPAPTFVPTANITDSASSAERWYAQTTDEVAENPAPTFVPTANNSTTLFTVASGERWYTQRSSSTECEEEVYATATATARR